MQTEDKYMNLISTLDAMRDLQHGWNRHPALHKRGVEEDAAPVTPEAIRRGFDLFAEFTHKDVNARGYTVLLSATIDMGLSWTLLHNTHIHHLRVLADGSVYWRYYLSVDALRENIIIGTPNDMAKLIGQLHYALSHYDPQFEEYPGIITQVDYELFDNRLKARKIWERIAVSIVDV